MTGVIVRLMPLRGRDRIRLDAWPPRPAPCCTRRSVAVREHAVENQGVEVHVQIEPASEPLDHRHAAGVAVAKAPPARTSSLERQQNARVDREHGPTELVVPCQEIAEPVGQAQHPLAHRDVRQDAVHEARGALGHAPASAARTESAALAGEGHEPLESAGAAEPGKAMRQDAAREELPELLFHELWQPVAIGGMRRRIQERLQMLVDHAVQHAVLGGAGLISGKGVGHADDVGAVSGG